MPALCPKDRDRLVKLLGMTASSQDGEAINAMRLANRLIKENDLTWEQVLLAGNAPFWPGGVEQTVWPGRRWSPPPPPPPRPQVFPWQFVARTILARHTHDINEWEEHFLASILARRSDLTIKQRGILDRIARKCGLSETAA